MGCKKGSSRSIGSMCGATPLAWILERSKRRGVHRGGQLQTSSLRPARLSVMVSVSFVMGGISEASDGERRSVVDRPQGAAAVGDGLAYLKSSDRAASVISRTAGWVMRRSTEIA